jgi:hypothetical protein
MGGREEKVDEAVATVSDDGGDGWWPTLVDWRWRWSGIGF